MATPKNVAMFALATAFFAYNQASADDDILIKDFDFSFSPNGQEVAYYSYRGNTRPDIYKRRGHGAEQNLTSRSDTWDIEPDYSPDGKFIVYSSGENMADISLRIMREDGSEDRLLYDGPDNEVGANWSPDGSKILFTAYNQNTKTNALFVMNNDGSGARQLASDLGGAASGASWSANNEWIYFAHQADEKSQQDIYKIRANGQDLTRLTNSSMSQTTPVLSPDGNRIFFIGQQEGSPVGLYSIPASGASTDRAIKLIYQSEKENMYMLAPGPNNTLVYSEGDWSNGFGMGHTAIPKPLHE